MKEEVEIGTRFISRLVNRHEKLKKDRVERFSECLAKILCERFNEHWYPENPLKGQAYRLGENNQYFTVKEEENTSGKSTPEPETSDYHSESPSENSEDESLAKFSKTTNLGKTRPAGKNSPKQPTQYFYVPAPLWVPCPQNVVSYIPTYQPLAFYYVDVPSKSPVPRKPNPNLVKRLTKRASKA
ncbi:hypothetical protein Chor_005314 [Crotalus horridus]